MIDLSKLSPAPWFGPRITDDFPPGWVGVYEADQGGPIPCAKVFVTGRHDDDNSVANAAFAALARNAFDVMMRRGWGVRQVEGGWQAIENRPGSVVGVCGMIVKDDPFTALVKADEWYAELVDNGLSAGDIITNDVTRT